MEDFLMKKLSAVTDEERHILAGKNLNKNIYTGPGDFVINSDKITGGVRDITVRTHTRYTNFPLHKHNYLEIMIVLSGVITHRIDGEAITLGEGDILILNKHVAHSIDKVDTPDIGVNVILSDNFVESLSRELSEMMYLSVPYLSKTVKEIFGKSFKELLVEERMRRAAELIAKTDIPIGDIINSIGYENESYFHREFKKKWGKTPLTLRKEEKKS